MSGDARAEAECGSFAVLPFPVSFGQRGNIEGPREGDAALEQISAYKSSANTDWKSLGIVIVKTDAAEAKWCENKAE